MAAENTSAIDSAAETGPSKASRRRMISPGRRADQTDTSAAIHPAVSRFVGDVARTATPAMESAPPPVTAIAAAAARASPAITAKVTVTAPAFHRVADTVISHTSVTMYAATNRPKNTV